MVKLLNTIVVTLFFILGLFSLSFSQEQITITTYYPSPYGSYRELRANRLTVDPNRPMPTVDGALAWGSGRGVLSPDQGSSIELGGNGTTPFIDFSNDLVSDYDLRLILTGNNDLMVQGGRTTFTNDDGTPAVIRAKEVWFCSSY